MPSLVVILVNYNGAADTLACLGSLRRSSFRDFSTIVVDNGSQDALSPGLAGSFPEVTLLRSETNLGFAGGNNLGIRHALEQDAQMVLLLNNDTLVEPESLELLVQGMQRHAAGVAGPKILYHDPPRQIWFAGGWFQERTATGGHFGLGEPDDGRWDKPQQCAYITGCALLVRREVLEHIGLLDESFFAYLEDVDFCLRARAAGYTIWYEPAARIAHKVSRTAAWDSPVYLYLNSRNKLLLLRKHGWHGESIPALGHYFLRQFTRLLLKHRDLAAARAVWYGLLDGLRGATGPDGQGRLPLLGKPGARVRRAQLPGATGTP